LPRYYLTQTSNQARLQNTLYLPQFEHDACGIGFIAYTDGKPHPNILPLALKALTNLSHRGGVLADGKTSDGAGILCQLSYTFFAQALKKQDITPPKPGNLGVGQCFLPKDEKLLAQSMALIENVLASPGLGLELLTWRKVPTNRRILGPQAEATQPTIQQLIVAPTTPGSQTDFERRLYLARRLIEKGALEANLEDIYICSFSSQVIVYKGLLLGDDLGKFYVDLQNYDFQVGMAIFHQRYSTNTFPTWPRAQPFRVLCHNGEINTIQGNENWIRARESKLASEVWGANIEHLKPVIDETGSDSAKFDNVLELLTQSGRELPHAVAMMAPEAWEMLPDKPENEARRNFYAYHACLTEPWDGPAALVFCDGQTVGITLDRNGLRPMRYTITKDNLVIAGSEAGFIELDQINIVKKGRLGPGQMLVVETGAQRIYEDEAIKEKLAGQKPYGEWVKEIIPLPTRLIPGLETTNPGQEISLEIYQSAFGYTAEEMIVVLRPMGATGKEPIASMGDDTPIALLSNFNRPVHHYLKQRFAQVTNPPIDPLREESGMSLRILLGHRGNILADGPKLARQLQLNTPVLQNDDLVAIQNQPDFATVKLYAIFKPKEVTQIEHVLQKLAQTAELAVRGKGVDMVIISDKAIDSTAVPIPILLAVGAVHHHLIKQGLRSQVSLVVETGEVRDVHHFAALIGYGAEAINPYLALTSAAKLVQMGKIKGITPTQAMANYARALEFGLLKIMSKMGIATVDSYCGAQIFEAIGLGKEVIDLCFAGTPSQLGGASLVDLAQIALRNHQKTFGPTGPRLESPGQFKFKRSGEFHAFNPIAVRTLQKAARTNDYATYKKFSKMANCDAVVSPKDGLQVLSDRKPIPLEEVEPISEIVRRFSTAAMSHGALSSEAHETLAMAMNRLGGMANSGEGGEAPERFGTNRNSAIKQVASGRFGVIPAYLMSARELQIKMAQGSKPGEGGQLPGHKVSVEIARLRYSSPGVELISPPPHHDIYSIEDLAQLIYDLKQINPMAAVSVKLVAETGVGTIAAGVVKGGADVVHISGGVGGTGASPLSSIKSAGLPFELGLAEAQQTLIANDLRDRVRLRTDGGLQTGHDIVLAALLGADEFSFGTAALVAEGCIMARTCHTNTCPVGIATQRLNLREKFPGQPEWVIAYMTFVAQEVREILAEMGYSRLNDIIGHTELLKQNGVEQLNLKPLLATPDPSGFLPRRNILASNDICEVNAMNWQLLEAARPALQEGKQVNIQLNIKNTDRSIGATLSGAIAARCGPKGLPENQIHFIFTGSAGQSFGVFNNYGMHLTLIGEANDYVGKGMAGGEIILKFPPEAPLESHKNTILGNTALYGATGGRLFAAGLAGERFAVRNSGAVAVVEGVGNHGCEYMTGGTVAILGQVGFNFGAGMSGGIVYIFDEKRDLSERLNPDMVEISPVDSPEDIARLCQLMQEHLAKTGSQRAKWIIDHRHIALPLFKKVAPIQTETVTSSVPTEVKVEEAEAELVESEARS
jgi:glutamate synthase (ferredoxin)